MFPGHLSIRHGRLDLAWSVLAVLEELTTSRYSEVAGTPLEGKRFRVRVRGPLPACRPRRASLWCRPSLRRLGRGRSPRGWR